MNSKVNIHSLVVVVTITIHYKVDLHVNILMKILKIITFPFVLLITID